MLISNASTLILLAKADSLNIFLDYVKKIGIPRVVYGEIVYKENSFEVLSIKKELEKARITIFNVDKRNYADILRQFKLDEGEAATYALYKKISGKAILTDDRELIKLCRIENIPFICAMAVIVRLSENNMIKKQDAMEKLDKIYSYGRYSKEIYSFFKAKLG